MASGYYMEQLRKCKGKLGRFPAGQGHGPIGVCGKILLAAVGTVGGRWAGGGSCNGSGEGWLPHQQLWVLWPFLPSCGPRNMGGLEMLKMGCRCGSA